MVTSVLLVDPQPVVRTGVRGILASNDRLRVAGECASVGEAYQLMDELRPQVVVTEVMLGCRSGVELVTRIDKEYPGVRPMVLSAFTEESYAARAIKAGAWGYITKTSPASTILAAVLRVASGKMAFSDDAVMQAVRQREVGTDGEPESVLTNREMELFMLLGRGMSPQDIAECLSISLKTVYRHIANIKRHIGLGAGTNLIHFATAWIIENRARTVTAIQFSEEAQRPVSPLRTATGVDR